MKKAAKQLYVILCVNVDNGQTETKPLQIDCDTEFTRQNCTEYRNLSRSGDGNGVIIPQQTSERELTSQVPIVL